MSELQAVCAALNAIDGEILQMAQGLHGRAQTYSRASAAASAEARKAEGHAAAALAQTANALANAARHCSQAAALLVSSSREGQAYVQRTVGSSAGGQGQSGVATEAAPITSATSVAEIEGWLAEVNPGYTGDPYDPRSSNCGSCAEAVFRRLNGDVSASAGTSTLSIEAMQSATGRKQVPMTPAEIQRTLIAAGPGSHAVIGVDREFGPGHWFNAYYDGQKVVTIDGQCGRVRGWPPEYGSPSNKVVYWDAGVS